MFCVCIPRKAQYIMQLYKNWITTIGRCLARLRKCRRNFSFPRTQRYIAQFRNRTKSRQPCNLHYYPLCCIAAMLEILKLSVFSKNTAGRYSKFGHRTWNRKITIRLFVVTQLNQLERRTVIKRFPALTGQAFVVS